MMKEEFECAIDQCGLPLKMDEATQGGNCWVRAVKEQLERPELGKQFFFFIITIEQSNSQSQ